MKTRYQLFSRYTIGFVVLMVIAIGSLVDLVLNPVNNHLLSEILALTSMALLIGLHIRSNYRLRGDLKNLYSGSEELKASHAHLEDTLVYQNNLLLSATSNEAQVRTMLESSLDALVIIDQQGLVKEFNPAAEKTFGWSKQEILGRPMAEILIPERMREAHKLGMDHYQHTGKGPIIGKRLQLNALHKLGHEFPIEITIAAISTENGHIFTAFIRDISEQIQRLSELRISSIAFNASSPIMITDNKNRVIRVNPAFEEVTGFSEAEVIGKEPKEFQKSGQQDREFYNRMWRTIREQRQWAGEIYNQRKNGELYPQYLEITAVDDEYGHHTHYIAHFTDITEQKKTEQTLKKAMQDAEQANEAKSRFLATMSHEIRTPLGAVLGILEMLKQTRPTQEQANFIKTGEHSGRQLQEIINSILDFSKMQAGKLQIINAPIRLHEVLVGARDMLQTQASNKGLELSINISPEVPAFVLADSTRIRQILLNLINNAIKFTENGHIEVLLYAKPKEGQRFMLYGDVIDTGIGLSKSVRESLFQEFSSGHEPASTPHTGSGLGLAICKQLVTLMGGEISASPNPPQGTRFSFHIKLEKTQEEDVIKHENRFLMKTVITNPDICILLAEDSPANRMIFSHYLQSANIRHRMVNNGQEAVDAFREQSYDLVLMDISMPVMNGIIATGEIRKLEKTGQHTPIIALTAHTMEDEIESYLAHGMDDHLPKPLNKEKLMQCIEQWTGQQGEPKGSDMPEASPPVSQTVSPQNEADTRPAYTDELVDQAVIRQLLIDTSAEVVPELLGFYIQETGKILDKIKQANSAHDADALQFNVHTLGSSAGSHANTLLHKSAREIEHLLREGKTGPAFAQVDELLQLADDSLNAMQNYLDTSATHPPST